MIEIEKTLERTSVSFEDLKDALDKAQRIARDGTASVSSEEGAQSLK